jgi:hypothetical protein
MRARTVFTGRDIAAWRTYTSRCANPRKYEPIWAVSRLVKGECNVYSFAGRPSLCGEPRLRTRRGSASRESPRIWLAVLTVVSRGLLARGQAPEKLSERVRSQ